MNPELKRLLDGDPQASLLSPEGRERILQFYEIVLKENQVQNLTRLVSPQDFYFGHVQDVLELLKIQKIAYPALDLGSGVGIPGLMTALVETGEWVLAESEKRKAEYLEKAANELGLSQRVRVFHGRAEDFLRKNAVQTVVIRAVGTVEKIYSWIRGSSTWNSLLLFKGPSWETEWKAFQESKFKHQLKVLSEHDYQTGPETDFKTRKIVHIRRV